MRNEVTTAYRMEDRHDEQDGAGRCQREISDEALSATGHDLSSDRRNLVR